jgi:hypothetical protein
MEYDNDKIDEMVLALLYLTSFYQKVVIRAWKSHDWDALDRLYGKGYISDPKSKAKSIAFSEEGFKLSEELFKKHFAKTA